MELYKINDCSLNDSHKTSTAIALNNSFPVITVITKTTIMMTLIARTQLDAA